jgi:predicted nucleic acid-binding protein
VIVIDTCVWIEVLIGSKTGARYLALWDAPKNIIVPTIIQFELRKWCERNVGEDAVLNAISATRRCIVQPLTEKIALDAAEISATHNLAALDALIYATAIDGDATLVTCDAHFRGLVGVEFAPK